MDAVGYGSFTRTEHFLIEWKPKNNTMISLQKFYLCSLSDRFLASFPYKLAHVILLRRSDHILEHLTGLCRMLLSSQHQMFLKVLPSPNTVSGLLPRWIEVLDQQFWVIYSSNKLCHGSGAILTMCSKLSVYCSAFVVTATTSIRCKSESRRWEVPM